MAFLVSVGTLFIGFRNAKTAQKALSQKTDEAYTKQLETRIDSLEKDLVNKAAEIIKLTDEKFALMQRLFDAK